MSATLQARANANTAPVGVQQYATFYVGELLLGVDIRLVQEINRQLDITPVPNAPRHVRGVINLRGDVATVIDLRQVLGLSPAEETRDTRNLIVHSQGESIGLLVDRISDILTLRADEIALPPSNIKGIDSRYFRGVHNHGDQIAVLIDVEQVLADRD
ncbi:chemotaxis protein CheW [Botrimarina hoheduenensis]|uniref:Chemotaxis protein CheW n=1 Tax=Botrimarina hoheduenensis TaxID=2528000 RepID=A0A5C5WBI9_9BACT|nr:chemotaxis protein CheW [Botrimarina hoheduenensis]TWT48258.1 Chemotaxis protein CheW [Botrimarina hoheduenensis]